MVEIAKLAIDYGADVNSKTEDFEQPAIVLAADSPGSFELVKYLFEHNANINAVGKAGRTALAEAAEHCYDNILKYLISKKANLDIQENYYKGDTALIRSIKGKNYSYDLTKYNITSNILIDAGANLNLQNTYGRTALHVAAAGKNYKLVKSLIEAGANANIKLYPKQLSEYKDIFYSNNI
jgi:ankyrin repeat protein